MTFNSHDYAQFSGQKVKSPLQILLLLSVDAVKNELV